MQKKSFALLALFGITMLLSSCNDTFEENVLSSNENAVAELATRALMTDSLESENAIQLVETEELKILKENLVKTKMQRASTLAYNDDENFSSNIYAIRELPITIYAKGVIGNTNKRYWSCDGTNKEVVLESNASGVKQQFYLKVLPASSGIPYLIYSQAANTPLVVGYYNSNPNNKILFAQPDNSGSLFSASWDLIPSQTKEYFAIESQSYLGQSDPNNMWSVFNYAIEVKNDNKLGYGQYTNKAHQEFMIKPFNAFQLSQVTYDAGSATITPASDIKIVSTTRNTSVESKPYTIPILKIYNETSYFSEKKSSIKFDISNPTKQFRRPTVQANRIVLPEPNTPYDATYKTSNTQSLSKLIYFDIEGDAPENSLIEVTTYIKTYNVSINYTATAYYNGREIKFSGVWRGYVVSDPKLAKPTHIPRFFDLDTGDEIFYFTRSEIRTTFKK